MYIFFKLLFFSYYNFLKNIKTLSKFLLNFRKKSFNPEKKENFVLENFKGHLKMSNLIYKTVGKLNSVLGIVSLNRKQNLHFKNSSSYVCFNDILIIKIIKFRK